MWSEWLDSNHCLLPSANSDSLRSRMVVSGTAVHRYSLLCAETPPKTVHRTVFVLRSSLDPEPLFRNNQEAARINSFSKKIKDTVKRYPLFFIGVTGFEPAASWSRTKHSTGLSHTPITVSVYHFFSLLSILPPNFFTPFFQNYVGLSMICYTFDEKEIRIFLGEDQLSGRIGKLL